MSSIHPSIDKPMTGALRRRRTRRWLSASLVCLAVVAAGCSSGSDSAESAPTTASPAATTASQSNRTAPDDLPESTMPGKSTATAVGASGDTQSYCADVAREQDRLGSLDPSSSAAERLRASQEAFAQITVHAPSDLKSDLIKINEAVQKATSFASLPSSLAGDLGPPLKRAMTWFAKHCGITMQVG